MQLDTSERIRKQFKQLDTNNDGMLQPDQFVALLQSFEVYVPKKKFTKLQSKFKKALDLTFAQAYIQADRLGFKDFIYKQQYIARVFKQLRQSEHPLASAPQHVSHQSRLTLKVSTPVDVPGTFLKGEVLFGKRANYIFDKMHLEPEQEVVAMVIVGSAVPNDHAFAEEIQKTIETLLSFLSQQLSAVKFIKLKVWAVNSQVVIKVTLRLKLVQQLLNTILGGILALSSHDPELQIKLSVMLNKTLSQIYDHGVGVFKSLNDGIRIQVNLNANPQAVGQIKSKVKNAEKLWKKLNIDSLFDDPKFGGIISALLFNHVRLDLQFADLFDFKDEWDLPIVQLKNILTQAVAGLFPELKSLLGILLGRGTSRVRVLLKLKQLGAQAEFSTEGLGKWVAAGIQ